MKRLIIIVVTLATVLGARAQVGEYRNEFYWGVTGGYMFSRVSFMPKVTQGYLGGETIGLSCRYTSEKYFTAICSIVGEVNYSKVGWSENILTINSEQVYNNYNGEAEYYDRIQHYVEVPIMARLAWGGEQRGCQFFFQMGPQFGYFIDESISTNFDLETANTSDRANATIAQFDMAVENKFDYGIAAGLGLEVIVPKVGRMLLEGRYYFGLANIYGNTKSDYFGKSNHSSMGVKVSFLI